MKIFYKILALILFTLFTGLNAQVIVGDSTKLVETSLIKCGNSDTMTLVIRNGTGATITSVTLLDTLPSGVHFTSLISNSAIASYTVNNGIITFNINDMLDNEVVRIKFLIRAACQVNISANGVKQKLKLTYSGATGSPILKSGVDLTSVVYTPSLVLSAVGSVNNPNAIVGTQYSRKWKIINNSAEANSDTFVLKIAYQDFTSFVSLKIDGVPYTPTVSGDSILITHVKTLRNNNLYPNDSILIEETYTVNSCFTSSGSSKISVFRGCFNQLFCVESYQNASVQTQVTVPNLKSLFSFKYGCKGNWDTLTVRLVNIGTGMARQIKFDVNSSYNDYFVLGGTPISFFDSSKSKVKLGANGTFSRIHTTGVTSFPYTRSFWPVSTPPRLLNFEYLTLNAGDTLFFEIPFYNPCIDNSVCGSREKSCNFYMEYKNNCLNSSYSIPRTVIMHEANRFLPFVDGPTDLNNGDTAVFNFGLDPNAYTNFRYNNNGFMVLEMNMPSGMVWSGNNSDLQLRRLSDASTDNADSVYWDASTNTLKAFYKYNASPVGIATNRTNYFILPKFVLDCSGSSANNENIYFDVFDYRDANCTMCKEPFGCTKTYTITKHCPSPCPRGGVSPYFSGVERITLGVPDNNQDGLPDASGSLDRTKIQLNKVVALDTFKLILKGTITRGSQSPAVFSHGYAESTIPSIGYLTTEISSKINIKDSSSNSSFTVSNLPVSITNSGVSRTFKWDFSNTVSGYPGSYNFGHGDSFVLEALYVFNKDAINYGNDLSNSIVNKVYVSPYANPTSDTAKYRCDDYNALLKTVTNYYTVYNPDNFTFNGCNSYIAYYRAYLSIGECCNNYNGSIHFPYEYRTYGYWDSLKVMIPTGYSIDSANLYFSNGTKVGNANSIYRWSVTPAYSSSSYKMYDIGKYFTPEGGSIVPSRGGFYAHMQVYLKPGCNTPNTTPLQRPSDYEFKSINSWASRPNNKTTDAYPGSSAWNIIKNYGSGTTVFNAPSLDVSNYGAVSKISENKLVSWDIKLQNNSNISDGANSWLAGYSKSGLIVIDSIYNLTTNSKLVQSTGIYRVGNVLKNGGNATYRVFTSQNACRNDSMKIYTGWNCQGYPTSLSNASCKNDSSTVYLNSATSDVKIEFINQPTASIDMCDTVEYELSVSEKQTAYTFKNYLEVQFPDFGVGINIVPNSSYFHYTNSGTYAQISPVNASSGVYRYFVADSNNVFKSNGLAPYASAPNNEYKLKFKAVVNCDFVSGSNIKFLAYNTNSCGVVQSPDIKLSIVDITGAPSRKLYFSTNSVSEIKPCDKGIEVSVKIKNLQFSSSSNTDYLYVTLPSGVLYQANSVRFLRSPFSDTVPNISTMGDRQILTWVSDNIPANDSSIVTFNIYSPSDIPCGASPFFEVQTRSTYNTWCKSINCNSQVQNSYEITNMPVRKPNISFLNGEMKVVKDTTLGNIYVVDSLIANNFLFANNGNDTGNLYISFYFDSNRNNQYDVGERIYFTDSIKFFAHSTNRLINSTRVFTKNTLSDTVKVFGSVKCNCNKTHFPINPQFNYTPLLVDAMAMELQLHGNMVQGWFLSPEQADYAIIYRKFGENGQYTIINTIENLNHRVYVFDDVIPKDYCGDIHYKIEFYKQGFLYQTLQNKSIHYCLNSNWVIIPNPNTGKFTIKKERLQLKTIDVSIYSSSGELVLEKQGVVLHNNTYDFEEYKLSKGLYSIVIKEKEGVSVLKLMIQ